MKIIFDNAQIGKSIKNLRIKSDMTIKELANELSVSASTVSRIEAGKTVPSLISIIKFCNLMNVSMDSVVFYNLG